MRPRTTLEGRPSGEVLYRSAEQAAKYLHHEGKVKNWPRLTEAAELIEWLLDELPVPTPEHAFSSVTRGEWIEAKVARRIQGLCRSSWHDSGHSSHSTCESCDGNFMRRHTIETERQWWTHLADIAEDYGRATGWSPPGAAPCPICGIPGAISCLRDDCAPKVVAWDPTTGWTSNG
jgi:hypothetical protein